MRQAVFAIPFAVPQAEQTGQEVLLFVSADQGRTWNLYARQSAALGQFAFQAARDGEYWFASHTVPVGTTVPTDTPLVPELKVVVDTTEPDLDVQTSVDRDGRIQISWEATDPHVLADSLKIEYQSALGKAWRVIDLDESKSATEATTVRGQTAWQPEGGGRFVSIRAEIHDTAGNVQRAMRRLLLPASAVRNTNEAARSVSAADVPSDPLADHGLGTGPSEFTTRSVVPQSGSGAEGSTTRSVVPQWGSGAPEATIDATAAADAFEPGQSATEVARNAYRLGPERDAAAPPDPFADTTSPDESASPATTPWPTDAQDVWSGADYGQAGAEFTSSSGVDPSAQQTSENEPAKSDGPATEEEPQAAPEEASRPENTNAYGLPPGERPRMTRTTRFNLAYSVDAAGPMGLEKVELWVTRNGGRDWNLWGIDEDMESPFLVELEREGIFGFRVVLVSKNGLASQTPRAGDLADLWVGIDTTAPTAEITSARYGTGPHAGHLDIQWTATDDHLGPRPVTLAFGEQPKGPWTTIASGLPNDGQYFWRVDAGVPDKFYLRLEVRDEAGNRTVHQLDQAIQSAGLTPKGRVSDFEPLFE
jgi:hypothetical protein